MGDHIAPYHAYGSDGSIVPLADTAALADDHAASAVTADAIESADPAVLAQQQFHGMRYALAQRPVGAAGKALNVVLALSFEKQGEVVMSIVNSTTHGGRTTSPIIDGDKVVSISVSSYFGAGVETMEELELALDGVREECARLIGAGKKVIVP